MDYVVVSLGGSILVPGEKDSEHISAIAGLMRSLCKELHLVLVCGGGKVARYYISTGKELGASREQQDELGIEITRMNARLLQLALGKEAFGSIPRTVEEAVREARRGKMLVMGGTVPGHTTDAVSALVAEALGGLPPRPNALKPLDPRGTLDAISQSAQVMPTNDLILTVGPVFQSALGRILNGEAP